LENIGLMDSKRKNYRKKAEFQQMERAKSFNSLIMKLCACQMRPMRKVDYRKSPDNQKLDSAMVQLFQQRRNGVQSAISPLKAAHGRFVEKMMRTAEKKQELDHWIRDSKMDIIKKDTEEMLRMDQQQVQEDWTFLGARSTEYKLRVPYPENGVKRVCIKSNGYPAGKATTVSFGWVRSEQHTEWVVTCRSGWCRGYEFDLALRVESRVVYEVELNLLKKDIQFKEQELRQVERDHDEVRLEDRTLAADIEKYTKQMTFFGECTYLSNQKTLPLGEWKRLQPFYLWAASEEGQATFRDPERSEQIVAKFCQIHGIVEKYKEACGLV